MFRSSRGPRIPDPRGGPASGGGAGAARRSASARGTVLVIRNFPRLSGRRIWLGCDHTTPVLAFPFPDSAAIGTATSPRSWNGLSPKGRRGLTPVIRRWRAAAETIMPDLGGRRALAGGAFLLSVEPSRAAAETSKPRRSPVIVTPIPPLPEPPVGSAGPAASSQPMVAPDPPRQAAKSASVACRRARAKAPPPPAAKPSATDKEA